MLQHSAKPFFPLLPDIPLVPRLGGGRTKEPNFVVHWLNNKEMAFTHAAEHLLQDVSDKVLQLQYRKDVCNMERDAEKLQHESKWRLPALYSDSVIWKNNILKLQFLRTLTRH